MSNAAAKGSPHQPATRVTLIAQAPPPAAEANCFAPGAAISGTHLARTGACAGRLARAELCFCAPDPASRQTAAALGLEAAAEPALRSCDFGRWRNLTLAEVAAGEPDRFASWLRDASVTPPEGESAMDLVARVGEWLDTQADGLNRLIVAHPMVVRAAAVHAAAGTPASWFRIDVGFLSKTVLTHSGAFWRVALLNADL